MDRRSFIKFGAAFGGLAFVSAQVSAVATASGSDKGAHAGGVGRVVKTDEEWKRLLTPEQYEVTRRKGTEAPYTSPLNKEYGRGTYLCVCCDLAVFSSKTKFDSHTGWPSFWASISKRNAREVEDRSLPEVRTEVICARCDAHLGHVFDDGPAPTGLRYCMNGVALKFVAKA
jgi:peptide-methionine (R)-S-oxide reductase